MSSVTLYNCSVGRSDCSRCHTADQKYGCVWCGSAQASCLYSDSCSEPVQQTCPAPVINSVSTPVTFSNHSVITQTSQKPFVSLSFSFPQIEPLSGLLEGGTLLTISGSNLGQKADDILHSVSVAEVPCAVIPSLYEVSSRYAATAAATCERFHHQCVSVREHVHVSEASRLFVLQDRVQDQSQRRREGGPGLC